MEQLKHNIIYKTTNIINGKIYIGVHSTNNINDKYLGSGKLLKRAFKKHGKENFKRVVLHDFNTRKEADDKEGDLICSVFINSAKNYNLALGGIGGGGKSNKGYKHTEEAIKQIANAGKRPCKETTKQKIGSSNRGLKRSLECIEDNKKNRIEYYKNNTSKRKGVVLSLETRTKISESKKGVKLTEEHKRKIGRTLKDINTGKIYDSVKSASKILNIPMRTLSRYLKTTEYNIKYI